MKKVPDQPGIAAKVFLPISDAGILVDMIIQNAHEGGLTDMTFTVPKVDYERAMEILHKVAREIQAWCRSEHADGPAERRCANRDP